ncbi:hypothetical protein [Pseudomonas xionganensis]|uniref:30S ribosomal protein S3 n=1 Tax=Pseudomonas xionganensis TaxID=2654845 RepID=A0A6I4KUB0_9PSED|nr:hypothetical protein [Pseudomonas xionganensis]MVW75258.1 hypothetical protein [Pseudomonas xionganensis]
MDYLIVALTSLAGLYFHWWLYVRIKLWMARDLALSFAGDSVAKRGYMLDSLQQAQHARLKGKALLTHLEDAAQRYPNS